MMRAIPAALFLSLAAAAAQAPALPGLNSQVADSAPPALVTARARLGESLIVADRTVTAQWLASLTELEKSRAAAGDYEGAQRVRARGELALAAAGTDDGRIPVPLTVSAATNKGTGLSVNESQTMAEFRNTGAFIEWDITGEFKGSYEVLLTHAVVGGRDHTAGITPVTGNIPAGWRKQKEDPDYSAPVAGGWVAFQNRSNLGGSNPVLRREIVSTGGWNSWRTVSLGRISLPQSRLGKFRLTGEEVAAQGLMHFRQIELVPAGAPAAAATDGELKLEKGRLLFEREFRTRIGPGIASYRMTLTGLEQQAIRTKNNDLLFRVREEMKLLTESPEKLAFSSDEALASASSAITLTVGDSFNCSRRGEVQLDTGKNFLTKLRPAGSASITWRLSAFNVGSGEYAVAIKGRVPVNGGGKATLAALGASSAPAGTSLKFDVKPVVTPENRGKPLASGEMPAAESRTEEPGKIVIAKNAENLTLSITGLTHGDGWLMDLVSVTLTRTGGVPEERKTP